MNKTQAVVRCKVFGCMAYLDDNGVWRTVPDDKEQEVVKRFLIARNEPPFRVVVSPIRYREPEERAVVRERLGDLFRQVPGVSVVGETSNVV